LAQIKRAEAEMFLWQALVDKITGNKYYFAEWQSNANRIGGLKDFYF
jgi:hypothetical protein